MSYFSREEDPPRPSKLVESPLTAKEDQQVVVAYQETGSVVEASKFNVTQRDLRTRLLDKLADVVTEEDIALKFKELLDAKSIVKDADGNVITERSLPSLQLKALKLLTEVRGDTAPIKIAKVEHKTEKREYVMTDGRTVKIDDVDITAEIAKEELKNGG